MFLFPLVYLLSFLIACREVWAKRPAGITWFFIIGLPLSITSLSVVHLYGFDSLIPVLQYAKEGIVLACFGFIMYTLPSMPAFNGLDRLMLLFFLYVGVYIFLPLGSFVDVL